MLVHGGIDCDGSYLSDLFIFDLKYFRWKKAIVEEPVGWLS